MQRPVCECGTPMGIHARTPDGRPRWKCKECKTSTTDSGFVQLGYDAALADKHYNHLQNRIKNGAKRFVITSAVNNSPKHAKAFRALKMYCEYNDADLIVIPVHYKNISLYTAAQEYKKRWNKDLQPYIIDRPLKLGGNVIVRADIKVQATAANPLAGKQAINGRTWVIFGHPQVAMQPVAAPANRLPKRMYTTGAITLPNYSQTDKGAKAEFHHVICALTVEVVDNSFSFIRHLHADSKGGFYDLDTYYDEGGVYSSDGIDLLVPGDTHVKFIRPAVKKATYTDKNSIVKALKPKGIVHHDILDTYFGSHHHEKDPLLQYKKYHKRDHSARAEFDQVVDFVNETTPKGCTAYFVPSNHHDHAYKWLNRVDPNQDHENADFIHEMRLLQQKNILKGKTEDPLRIYLSPRLECKFKFLDRSTPFVNKGVDFSQHGDIGTNGSRGSAAAFANTVYRVMIGHGHGARIVKGATQVGTSTGRREYENGLSDHTNTHGIQYENGKTTLLDIYKGKWRL